jgi:hypothetical protein
MNSGVTPADPVLFGLLDQLLGMPAMASSVNRDQCSLLTAVGESGEIQLLPFLLKSDDRTEDLCE